MGMLIDIKKIDETNQEVFYTFFTPEGDIGKVSIKKHNGEFFVIEEPEWDKESKLAIRVGIVLVRHWKKGEYPDITMWA